MNKRIATIRTSSTRRQLEADVLDAYNDLRRTTDNSPMECYVGVAASMNLKPWQVQYIIIKRRKAGENVL